MALLGMVGLGLTNWGCSSPLEKAADDYAIVLLRGASALGATAVQSVELCRARTAVDFLRYRLTLELQRAQSGDSAGGARRKGPRGPAPVDQLQRARDWLGFDAEADAADAEAGRLALLWRARCEEADHAGIVLEATFATLRAFAQGLQTAAEAGTSETGLGVGLVKGPADTTSDWSGRLDDKTVPAVAPLKAVGAPLTALAALVEPGYSDRRLQEVARKSAGLVRESLAAVREYLLALDSDTAAAAEQLRTLARSGERYLVQQEARRAGAGSGKDDAPDGEALTAAFVQIREYVQFVGTLQEELREARLRLDGARAALDRLAAAHERLDESIERKERKQRKALAAALAQFNAALAEADRAVRALAQ